jgi:hypothetical protein
VYTEDERLSIDERYAQEALRGVEPRYVENVAVGDELGKRFRGPMVMGDIIAWLMGNGRHEISPTGSIGRIASGWAASTP